MKQRVLQFWNKYERHLSALTLVLGFTFDLLLAKRPDSIADNILLLFYLTLSATLIILLNRRSKPQRLETDPAFEHEKTAEPLFLLLVMQFCFGGLASNLLILYGKSGSFGSSLLFIIFLGVLLVGNEFLKSKYDQLRFNVAVFYFLLLTYLVIAVPTFVLHTIGTKTFLISGVASLVCMGVFISLLRIFALRENRRTQLWQMRGMILVIFLIFNGLYFANIIPPVPLSLKSAGIYHSITPLDAPSDSAIYTATYEPKKWYEFWRDTADNFNIAEGDPAYCYSAVFAPGELKTPISHRWEYFYPQTEKWITTGLVQFPINGGRAEGYRGYSKKQVLIDGQWRCTVETSSGKVIGRITFTVKTGGTPALSNAKL
ncbi:DUF2914 domain-containing protein [Patescibacteria group bacterium]|nr:DUF2914 domain-containing protein [Patescibacteria group bacterium]